MDYLYIVVHENTSFHTIIRRVYFIDHHVFDLGNILHLDAHVYWLFVNDLEAELLKERVKRSIHFVSERKNECLSASCISAIPLSFWQKWLMDPYPDFSVGLMSLLFRSPAGARLLSNIDVNAKMLWEWKSMTGEDLYQAVSIWKNPFPVFVCMLRDFPKHSTVMHALKLSESSPLESIVRQGIYMAEQLLYSYDYQTHPYVDVGVDPNHEWSKLFDAIQTVLPAGNRNLFTLSNMVMTTMLESKRAPVTLLDIDFLPPSN